MTGQHRGRPIPEAAPEGKSITTDTSILQSDAADRSEMGSADFFRTSFAVLVRGRTVRRHLYFNLPAAERTVRRAHARGDKAELILVRLVPVDSRQLDLEVEE